MPSHALDRAGRLSNTSVFVASDNGYMMGQHRESQNKGVPYEGSAKIPFLLRYPPKVPAGTVVDQALSCVDFLPTVLAMIGSASAWEVTAHST